MLIMIANLLQLGMLGILERENAAVLNESLKELAAITIKAFGEALLQFNIKCPFYLTQNDGTLIRYTLYILHTINCKYLSIVQRSQI